MAIPHVKDDIARGFASQIFRCDLEAELIQEENSLDKIFAGNLPACIDYIVARTAYTWLLELMLRKHVPTTKHLDLKFLWIGIMQDCLFKKHQDGFVAVSSIQPLNIMAATVWEHVMAHPANKLRWMPHGYGYTGSQYGPDPGISVSKMKITRLQKYIHSIGRFLHDQDFR